MLHTIQPFFRRSICSLVTTPLLPGKKNKIACSRQDAGELLNVKA